MEAIMGFVKNVWIKIVLIVGGIYLNVNSVTGIASLVYCRMGSVWNSALNIIMYSIKVSRNVFIVEQDVMFAIL